MKSKICIICNKEFTPNSANQKCCCKECSKELSKQKSLKHYYKNKEKRLEYGKQYRENHPKPKVVEKCIVCNKEYIKTSNSKCCSDECRIAYRKQQKYEYNKKYLPERYKNNPEFRLGQKLRGMIRRCLSLCYDTQKKNHTFDILGYTPNDLKLHLEKQFKDGMTWENQGTYWEIDHIKEVDTFNFILPNGETNYEQIKLANSLENLQPLTIEEHRKKSVEYMKLKHT